MTLKFASLCSAALVAFTMGMSSSAAFATPEFSALAVDARTGQILTADHEDGLRHPASLTKMMTLYVLFQDLKSGKITRDTKLRVSARAAAMAPSKLHLKAGTTITVDEAIKALVTKSANDAAATIAENIGGSESAFAARMTNVAHSIGMSRSTFSNASGLPNPAQYTTARDMATLGLRLMHDFPQYYPYFRVTSFMFHGHLIKTHNRLVQHYPGTDGIKTGYTESSGFNLVSSTKRGEKRLVGVVLGARSAATRERFMTAMFEKDFGKAHDGNMVAALAGSSKGISNPVTTPSAAEVATADKLNSKALAAVSANAADTQAAQDEMATATTGDAMPKVLEANLEDASPKPKKLPFAVVSANDQPETAATTLSDTWHVQVGAFPEKAQAEARLAALRSKLGRVLDGKQAVTIEAQKDGKAIYRARFAGFDAATAKKACNHIVHLGTSCLAVAPQG